MSTSTAHPQRAASTRTTPSQPKTLLFFLSAREVYRQPLFSTNEVFCSPDAPPAWENGRTTVYQCPTGSYDVRDVVHKLEGFEKPELIVVKADATLRNCPRNLSRLKCPRVLIVGDTHHQTKPIQNMIRYAREEQFDAVVFDHTRHHALYFLEAGVHNVQWIPAVDYAYHPREPKSSPTRGVTFFGQVGRHHPYRGKMIETLRSAGVPVEVMQGSPEYGADLYADSQISLNVSLNGDLNLRVFEALASGGFLLTDALPEASGLPSLFENGKHLVTWSSPEELVEKARHYLAHPDEAQAIRRAGREEIIQHHSPETKRRELLDLVFERKVNPRYSLEGLKTRAVTFSAMGNFTKYLHDRIEGYEAVQALHRVSDRVNLFCTDPQECAAHGNLPRLSLRPLSELRAQAPVAGEENVLWLEGVLDVDQIVFNFLGQTIVAPNAGHLLREQLAQVGFVADDAESMVFRRRSHCLGLGRAAQLGRLDYVKEAFGLAEESLQTADEAMFLAQLAESLGDPAAYRLNLERAAALDRNNVNALLSLAACYLDEGQLAPASMLVEEAARVTPLSAEIEELRRNLAAQVDGDDGLKSYFDMIGRRELELPAERKRRVLLITNLFPPQELGGYGRKMWEFAHGLRLRGHEVRVLTANVTSFAKTPTADEVALEKVVSRNLKLWGTWSGGGAQRLPDNAEVFRCMEHNRETIERAINDERPDVVFAGNMDFLGVGPIETVLNQNIPVLHALGNKTPGYDPGEQPFHSNYCIGCCSQWTASVLQSQGFMPGKIDVIYPGGRVDRFFRFFVPDSRRLRICFAGLVMPYKGVHTLVESLGILHQQGVDFTAEIAGESTDPNFIKELKTMAQNGGYAHKVAFTGFLDRSSLAALYARNNVLVFPSVFEEPFGISQVEALAAGLVVVSSGTGGAREVIRHDVDGLLFRANDPAALAERLMRLHTDKALFSRLQREGQKRAGEFSVDRSVFKIERLFDELIGV